MSQDRQTIEIELKAGQLEYLEAMAGKYSIPDVGKAVRCMIDHARSEPDSEESIFKVARCLDC